MLQLLINNLPAVIKKGTNFKLTRENPAFSDQGDYTFEVTLPLRGCPENRLIYGSLHRPESPLKSALTDLPFTLISPILTLSGSVHVTSITGEEIKVQLVAGRSEANLRTTDSDGNDIYIDKLNLGTLFDDQDVTTETHAEFTAINSFPELCQYLLYVGDSTNRQHGSYLQTPATFFQVVAADNKDDGVGYSSPYMRNAHTYGECNYSEETNYYDTYDDYRLDQKTLYDFHNIAPQPRLYDCLQRILKAAGFTLIEHTDFFMRSIVIVNTQKSINYNDYLPHWTLAEFIKEFNNFFATIIVFHEDHTAEIRYRADFYAGEKETITGISDDLTAEFSDDSADSNSSTGNVDYDWQTDDAMLRLPDEVWESVPATYFSDYTTLKAAYDALSTTEKQASNFLYIDSSTGYVYASLQNVNTSDYELSRVDYYPPLLREDVTRDITTTLKIIPARIAATDCSTYFNYNLPVLLASSIESVSSAFSVNVAVNSESTDTENASNDKPDFIEVAYAPGNVTAASSLILGSGAAKQLPIPLSVMVEHDPDTNLLKTIPFTDNNSPAAPTTGVFNLSDKTFMHIATFDASGLITSRIEHEFKFLVNAPLDITKTFIIRNRPYVCYKLEYTIHPDHITPLVTGTFYELNT